MKTVHVAAGIIRKEGSDELLAVQRGYGDMQGLWEFPGGKLMRGETPEDAVRRELMEELQVKVTNCVTSTPLSMTTPISISPWSATTAR